MHALEFGFITQGGTPAQAEPVSTPLTQSLYVCDPGAGPADTVGIALMGVVADTLPAWHDCNAAPVNPGHGSVGVVPVLVVPVLVEPLPETIGDPVVVLAVFPEVVAGVPGVPPIPWQTVP